MAICRAFSTVEGLAEAHLYQIPPVPRRPGGEREWGCIMSRVLETIARNLKFLREQKGWTQEEAAKQYGVTVIQVAKYEKGTNAPKVERLARIALLYGVSVDSIMGLKKMLVSSEE